MARQKEGLFKTRVLEELRKIPRSYWTHGNPHVHVGIPDILGCIEGQMYAFELKVGKNTASVKQVYELDLLQQAGCKIYVVNESSFPIIIKEITGKGGANG